MKLSWRYAGNNSILRNRFGFINLYLIAYNFIVASILFVSSSAVAAPSISSVVMIAPLESGKKVSYGGDGIDINLVIDLGGASSTYLRYQLWEQINGGSWVQINAGGGYRKISFYRERDLGVWFYERQKPVAPGLYRYRVHIVDDSNGTNAWSSGVESDVVEVRAPRKAPKDAPSFFSFTPSATTASLEELSDRFVFKDSTGTTFIRFAWATVSNDVPLSDLYYELLYKKVGTADWKVEKITRSPYSFGFVTAGSGEVPGMHDMEMYEFSIRACNPIGCGPSRNLSKPILFDYPEIDTSILNAKLNFKVFDLAGDIAVLQNYCFADSVTKKCKADFVRISGSVSGLSGGSTIYLHKGQSLLKQASGTSSDLNLSIDLSAMEVGSYVFNLTGAGKASGTHLRKRFYVYVPGEGEITTSGCTINPLNNSCDAEIKWKVSGDFPACLYRVNGATKTELSCVSSGGGEQSISVPLNVNPTSFEIQINEPAGIRTVDSLNAQAKFQDVSLEATPERCDIIRPAKFCIARVSWAASSDYAPCLFKGSEKITCTNEGHIDVPVASQNVIFSLVNGTSITDKVIAIDNVRALKAPTGSLTVASGSSNPCVPSNGTTCEVDVVMEHFGGDMGVTLYKGEAAWGNLGTSGETIPVKFTKKLLAESSGTRYSLRANYGGELYEFASITLYPTTLANQGYSLTSVQPTCTFNPLIETGCKSEVTWSMPVAGACIFVDGAATGFCPDSTMLTGTSGVPKPLGVHLYQLRKGNSPDAELVAQVAVTSKEETVASIKVSASSCGVDWCDLNLGVFTNYSGNVCLYDNGVRVESLCNLNRDLFFANYRVSRVAHHFQLVLETIEQDGSISKLTVAEKSLDNIAVVPDYKDLVVSECNYSRFVCSITVSWYSNLLDTCIYAKKTNQAIFCEDGQGTHSTVFDVTELTGNQFELRNVASGSSDLLAEFSVKNVFGGSSTSHTNLSSSSRSSFSSHESNSSSSAEIITEQSPYLTDGNVNSPPPTELPGSPVGTIAGQFRVSESGAASYSVPLNLPAGVAGVTPQLSFDYASQSGNGLLGQGWSLSGLSAITRCRKTLIHDGETNPITWSKDDRFCLDGQRLMLVSGAYYGQPNSEYRTEIDNYSLVTAVGGSDGHPDYFKVEAKDGSVSYYGYTSDSKLTGGVLNTTLNWALNRFQDNVGNGIEFVYNNNPASGQNIQEIRYGFPSPNGIMPSEARTDFKSKIQFSYDERDDKTDAYVAGYKFSQTRKLASVNIYNTDNSSGFETSKLFRHYQLKYMSRTTTDARYENTLTRLSHIYECVTTDIVGGSCLLPLSFSWGGGSHIAFDKNMTELSFPTAEPGRYVLNNLFADVTGDGKVDLIYLTYEKGIDETHADLSINIAYAKNDATGLGIQEHINLYNKPYENIRIATLDYNADGRQDLAVYDEGHWKVHLAVINTEKQWRISKVDVVNLGSLTDKDTLFMDVNGDGLADAVTAQGYYLLKRNTNAAHSNTAYSFSFQLTELTWGNTGFTEIDEPSPTSINALTNCTKVGENKKLQQETAADFNGDGAVDFLGTYNRTLICGASGGMQPAHVTLAYRYALVNYNGQLFNYGGAALQTPTVLGGGTDKLFTVDINSDGLSDIVQLGADKKLSVRMNTGAGFNTVQAWTTLSGLPTGSSPQFLDYNGDGAADVIWRDTTKGQMLVHYWGTGATTTATLFNTSFTEKDSYLVMDVSGDSVVDYLRISSESMSGRVGQMALKAEPICEEYPTGRGNEMGIQCNDPSYPVSQDQQHSAIYKIENGLGNNTQIAYGALSTSGRYQTADVNPELISHVVSNNCPPNIPAYCNPTYTSYSVDSSGFYGRLNGRWELPADHNVYDPTTKAIVAAGATTSKGNPVLEVNGSMQVVTMVKSSAPLPHAPQSMSEVNYFYSEAKMQAMGRGFLGFGRLKTVDKQTGITTVTTYRQDFPFAGSPLSTTVYKNNSPGAPILSYAINNWDAQIFGGDGARRFQPYLKQSSEYSYVMDSAGGVSTDALQTVTTATVMYPNEHGNVHEVTSVTQGSGNTITQKTTNEYFSNDAWAQRMGRLKRSSVNTTNLLGDSVTRIAEFKYYGVGSEGISGGAKGLLKEEKVITSEASDQLVTEYIYDQWGNKQTVSVTGAVGDGEIQTRSTTSTYDSSGRNLVSTKNHSNQESFFGQYNVYGQPQTATDKNKLSTEIKYDAFGSEYLRVEKLSAGETGAWTRKDSGYCTTSNCPGGAAFYTHSRVSGGGEAVEYFDILGRVIRAGKISFDGRWVYTDTEYDKLSRVKRQSLPYYSGSTAQDWAENHYDDLGRITQVDSPHEQGTISSKTEYTASPNGLMTTLINPKGQKRKEVRNGLGQLIYVEDELGGSISYEYSVLGGLLSVTTSATDAADVVVKMCYDDLGRKTGMFDPDKGGFSGEDETCETVNNWTGNAAGAVDGWWHYRYNAFGELLEQRDPKGQRTLMQYDELGRMINRKDYESGSLLEAHTAWFYDTPFGESEPTDKTLGKLTAVVMSNNTSVIENNNRTCDKIYGNHCVIYRYNDRALVDMTWTLLSDGQDYFTETQYDDIGRAYEQRDVINGPIFMDSGVQTHFNEYGYAYRTVDIAPWDGTDGVLSTIKEVNVNGQVTKELRGNGLETVNTYYPKSGLLQSQVARDAIGTRVLQSNYYTWDELGNLTSRVNQGTRVFKEGQPLQQNNRKESFCYDALNRLVKTLPTDNPTCSGTASPTDDIAYDGLGNIKRKNGVGDYSYNRINGGPHAVTKAGSASYSYDNNGNMVAESNSGSGLGDRSFSYTSYDMVEKITRGSSSVVEFKYGPDRARWQRIDNDLTTTTYLGNVERIETANTHEVEWKRTVAGVVHTYKTTVDADKQNLQVLNVSKAYLYKDHLGSVDIITNQFGTPTHSMSFDPWGARRKGDSNDVLAWVKGAGETDQLVVQNMLGSLSLTGFSNPITTRGYTGHEMVDGMDIIHMNGRIYDAKIARFLQADPFIQAATNTQSFNRYSYVMNNPLNATDPSGFFSLTNELKKAAHQVPVHKFLHKYVPKAVPFIQIAMNFIPYGGPFYAAAFGADHAYYLSGGKESAANKSFGMSMVAMGAFKVIGGAFNGTEGVWAQNGAAHIFAHAVVGGVLSELQGGKFGHGFMSAGLTKGFMVNSGFDYSDASFSAVMGRTVVAGIVGGTISAMTGGKFANGAITAAMAHLFNQERTAAEQREYLKGLSKYLLQKTQEERDIINGWSDDDFKTYFGVSKDQGLFLVNRQLQMMEATLNLDIMSKEAQEMMSKVIEGLATHVATAGGDKVGKALVFSLRQLDLTLPALPNDYSGWNAMCHTPADCGFTSPSGAYTPINKIASPLARRW